MILRKLQLFNRNQSGFTLVEMVVTLAITGFIALGAAIANAQVLDQTSRNNDYTTASRHTLNAIHWISRDAQMAQTMEANGSSGFPLVLSWVEWDNTAHTANYSLENGELRRSYYIDSGEPSETLIAEYINHDAAMTNCVSDNGVLMLTVTASVGEGSNKTSVTKVREISSRPNL